MAVSAYSLYHQIGRLFFKAFGETNFRYFRIIEAIRLLALLTEKMRMDILIMLVIVTMAEFIPYSLAAPLYYMHEVMLTEKRKRPEDVRLVDSQNPCLQLCERHRSQAFSQLPHHDDTVGSGLDAMFLQQLCTVCFVHTVQRYNFLVNSES